MERLTIKLKYYPATLLQLLIPLALLWALRFPFVHENIEATGNPSLARLLELSFYGLQFDLCAWAWFNSLFILMKFLPLPFAAAKKYLLACNIIYLVSNLLMLLPAVADIPFFQFNATHLRWHSVTAIWSDPSMGRIVLSFAKDYGIYFIGGLVIAFILAWSAFCIKPAGGALALSGRWRGFAARTGIFILAAGLTFVCIRGHVGGGRPLSIADAVWHTEDTGEIDAVLNTPFCIIRTLHDEGKIPPMLFFTEDRLREIRDSRHKGHPDTVTRRKNIMVIALESGASLWVDRLNPVPGDTVRQLMPFLDSIASASLVFPNTFTTGVRSIEGITNIFGGIPTFGDMILLSSPYYANTFDAPVALLKKKGYSTRFYFGGNHGSFNIDQTLKAFGFDEVVTRSEYGNEADYDGAWGIWDHKMGEYAARDLSQLPEPFIAGWFTLNPHGPYGVPSGWNDKGYRSADLMRRTVEYEDRALRHFFEVASSQPWFDNTVFVFVGDHGFRDLKGTIYDSPGILPHIITMIYAPDGTVAPGRDDRVAGQYDIAPTLLSLAEYDEDYISLGTPLLDENRSGYALMYIKGAYRLYGKEYAVSMTADFSGAEGVYDRVNDPYMEHALSEYDREEVRRMTVWAQAFMQDYSTRLNDNTLSIRK